MALGLRGAENWNSESHSENDNVESSVLLEDANHGSTRKRRHNSSQIEIMETFFKDCPHPNDKERQSLSDSLGLNASQVKFWFQNKRTQQKAQQKRMENSFLKTQNEKLRAENRSLKDAARNMSCLKCEKPFSVGGTSAPLDELKLENARLKMELEGLQNLAKNYVDNTIWNDPRFTAPLVPPRSLDLELGGSSLGGQLVNNSGDGLMFTANTQFNPAHLAAFDEKMTFQRKPEGAFWPPSFTDDNFIRTKRPRLF